MADNTTLNAGTGGDTIASDDIGGVKYQRAKIVIGADGVNDGDVAAANPLPIEISDGTDTAAVSAAGALTVDGSAVTQPVSAASLPLPTGAATAAGQLADGHNVTIDNASGASAVNIQDGGNSITVDGTVGVTHPALGAGTEAAAQRVTIANDSTGVVSVDDGGGDLSVDWAGTAPPIGAGTEAAALRVTVATDSTGVLTVDGTVTANAGTGTMTVDGSGVTQPVSAASLPLPTGAATAAAQLADGHNVTVDNATGAPANVQIGDGTSQATVRNLAANDSLNVAIVDGAGDQITSFGGGTQYVEDAAGASDPTGTAQILVRQDTPAALVSLDGDNVARRGTDYGAAFTQILDSSGNFINSFGGSGGTSHTDDAAFSIGSASSITPMGALADETAPDSVDEGDVGVPRMTLDRKLLTRIVGATDGNRVDVDASGHLQVDIAADSAGLATSANQLADGHNVTVDNTTGAPANVQIGDGTDTALVSAGGALLVDASATTQPVSGTVTVTHPALGGGVEAGAQRVTIASDSTGQVTIDGTVTANAGTGTMTVDGSGVTQPVSAASLPLPTGAATSANQLADGHNVTVDNASGGSAVNIQDGGNSITIDGTVTTTAGTGLVNTVSTNNSTTSTLGISGVFTGTGDDVTNYASVTVQLDSSHDSATDGMTFQFSIDDTNWDDVSLFTYTAADGARRFQFPVTGQYFRIVYTNGGTGQSHFRVQTILHATNVLTSIHRLADTTHPDRSAQIVKAALVAQAAGSGDFTTIDATAGGNLKVSLEEVAGPVGGGTEATALRVTVATDSTGLVSIDDGGGNISTDWNGTVPPIGAGTEAAALRVTMATDSTGQMTVDGTVTANAGTGTRTITGDVAHDTADSGSPLSMGYNAAEFAADPPQIDTDGDRVRGIATPQGIAWTLGGHPNIVSREYMTTGAQTNDAISDTVAAGSHVVVTECEVLASAAGTTNPAVRIGFGATAVPTEPTTGNFVDGMVLSHPGLAAGSGVVRGNGSGVVAIGAAGAELRITCDAPTTGQLTVLVSYYVTTL